jgi:hypothetical protein
MSDEGRLLYRGVIGGLRPRRYGMSDERRASLSGCHRGS